jgi:hypothetical protein
MGMKMYKMILVGLLFCGATWASQAATPSKDWNALREKTITLGLAAERVDKTLEQCRRKGMSLSDTETLLRPVYTANDELLPADYVFLKIEEGLAKQVDAGQVAVAAEFRLTCLRQAVRLVSSSRPARGGGAQHLIMHTCMALESGLPAEVFQNIFSRPGGVRYGRMIHVVEAGEVLHLAGLMPSNIQQIMNDCLDRDLDGDATLRVVDVVLTGRREGKSFESIHAALWIPKD